MVATVFSIIRNASVPFLNVSQKRPNLAPTYWRSVGDLTNRIYYFEEANRPNVFWVDLKKTGPQEWGSRQKASACQR